MSFPRISPSKSPTSVAESESVGLFKHSALNLSSDALSPMSKTFDYETSSGQPRYMTGYGGFQPHQDEEIQLPKLIVAPVVGYTGCYRGKNIGKLGRSEVHRTRLSAWEKDTVSGILGVPASRGDWEYSHYTNTCANFADKKCHESDTTNGGFDSSIDSLRSVSGFGSVLGSVNGVVDNVDSPSSWLRQSSRKETDRILLNIQQCLETRFKTAASARSALKGAFFGADTTCCGRLHQTHFFEMLRRLCGVVLTDEQCVHLSVSLDSVGRRRLSSTASRFSMEGASLMNDGDTYLHGESSPVLQNPQIEGEFVNYGRFLNILVPRNQIKS